MVPLDSPHRLPNEICLYSCLRAALYILLFSLIIAPLGFWNWLILFCVLFLAFGLPVFIWTFFAKRKAYIIVGCDRIATHSGRARDKPNEIDFRMIKKVEVVRSPLLYVLGLSRFSIWANPRIRLAGEREDIPKPDMMIYLKAWDAEWLKLLINKPKSALPDPWADPLK